MTPAPNIDGALIQWGDRLFYPDKRIVKDKQQPKLDATTAHQRAAAIRRRIKATVVRRATQVMVKVTGGGRGGAFVVGSIGALFVTAEVLLGRPPKNR